MTQTVSAETFPNKLSQVILALEIWNVTRLMTEMILMISLVQVHYRDEIDGCSDWRLFSILNHMCVLESVSVCKCVCVSTHACG